MNSNYGFVVIDDDPISNLITRQIIKDAIPDEPEVICFPDGASALKYFDTPEAGGGRPLNYILLDINMPVMTGWEFLDRYLKLPGEQRKSYRIYILSSSLDIRDREKASRNEHITGYLVKPISVASLQKILPVA